MTPAACDAEEVLRREIVRYSRWLSRLGYTPGTSGNLSARLDGDRFLVTPTGMSKGLIRASDLVIVDACGRLLEGSRKATSEIDMHLAIYRQKQSAAAVIHSHPPIATAFACSGRALDQVLCQEAVMTVGTVPLARYATTGTGEVASSLVPHLPEHDAMLLENHGAVTCGSSLTEAFLRMETIEHLAHVALVAHQLGTPQHLCDQRIRQLQQAKSKYQHGAEHYSGSEAAQDGPRTLRALP